MGAVTLPVCQLHALVFWSICDATTAFGAVADGLFQLQPVFETDKQSAQTAAEIDVLQTLPQDVAVVLTPGLTRLTSAAGLSSSTLSLAACRSESRMRFLPSLKTPSSCIS